MTGSSDTDWTLALAGVFQAAHLARAIARDGQCDSRAFAASRESLFQFEPESVAAVFGGTDGVASGLRSLYRQLAQAGQRELETSRYVAALMHLADRLRGNDSQMQGLRNDLEALARRLLNFDLGDTVQHEQLAQIYQERISPLGPRIMVRGEPLHLQNRDNAARIRVALLAGIRAAVLWRQTGGSKWQLVLGRRKTAMTARELVDTLDC
jgi:high frequency lysogenization protein